MFLRRLRTGGHTGRQRKPGPGSALIWLCDACPRLEILSMIPEKLEDQGKFHIIIDIFHHWSYPSRGPQSTTEVDSHVWIQNEGPCLFTLTSRMPVQCTKSTMHGWWKWIDANQGRCIGIGIWAFLGDLKQNFDHSWFGLLGQFVMHLTITNQHI